MKSLAEKCTTGGASNGRNYQKACEESRGSTSFLRLWYGSSLPRLRDFLGRARDGGETAVVERVRRSLDPRVGIIA